MVGHSDTFYELNFDLFTSYIRLQFLSLVCLLE